MNVSVRTVQRAQTHYGLGPVQPEHACHRLSPERRALAQRCIDDGWSFWQMRETYGFTHRTLARNFPGHAVPKAESIERAVMARQLTRILGRAA